MSTATPTTDHSERPHAERSSSQLGSLALCPGFRPKPTKKVHWVTAQGTRLHEALDSGDAGDLESTFEERMLRLCENYAASLPLHSREFQEQRFDTLEGRWGYTDRLRIRGKFVELLCPSPFGDTTASEMQDSDEADLLDWKAVRAKLVVDAEINLQGKDYVLAIFKDPQFTFLNTIHVHFVMPRFESVTTATYTRADIPRLELEIAAVLYAARDTDRDTYDGSTLTPHYDACKWCGMAGNCVALRRIYDGIARAYDPEGYGRLPALPSETHASKVKDPAARAQLQKLAELAEVWAASVRQHNLEQALQDDKNLPEGYMIDWPKGRRYVKSREALMKVAGEFGLSAEDIIDSSNIGWMRLEALLRSKHPRGAKKDAVERVETRLIELGAVERAEPSPSLKKVVHT